MFNNNNGYSLADIAAATNGGYGNGGFGGFGGEGAWLLFFFIIILAGGWGNNGWSNNGGGGNTGYITSDIQRGFDQSALVNGLSDINGAITNGFYTSQSNLTNQLNTIGMSLQNCCCENRAGLADLKYTIATENCADRQAISDALRDVIASNTANTQAILDKLCQQEIEALKAQNKKLQMESYLANLAASQNAQTGQLIANNNEQTATLLRQLNPVPIPAYVVANPNGCGCGNYSGCGNTGFYN